MSQRKLLNPKQQLFIAEYIKCKNATKAAIAAGYSKHTARHIGSQLLANLYISRAVEEGVNKQVERLEITADKVLQVIAGIAFHPEERSVTKLKATEQLGKHLKLFTDVTEVKAAVAVAEVTPEQLRAAIEEFEKKC